MKKDKTEFSKFLNDFLKTKNYKIEYISEILKVPLSTVGAYKAGNRIPKDEFVEKFITTFNIGKEEGDRIKRLAALDRTPEIIKKELDPKLTKLTKRERLQYEELLNQNALFFNDESISEEDKKKMVDALTEAFYAIKKSNKRTK